MTASEPSTSTAASRTGSSDRSGSTSDDAILQALARTEDPTPGPEPGTMLGRFRLDRVLGRGGMGVVWAARDERLGRDVAIKLLHAAHLRSATRRKRFLREAKAAAAVAHPGVARILEVGDEEGDVFLVFERVEGDTLRAAIARGPLPFSRILTLGTAMCRALSAAHEASIIHRDLKPENVVCTPDGGVKILDFGLAKWARSEQDAPAEGEPVSDAVTVDGQILGSPGYMAPEQALGRPATASSDLFSLGVVLFEMTTGRRPFAGATAMETLVSLSRDPAPAPASWGAGTPIAFRRLVHRCLAKDPAERPASALEVERLLAASATAGTSRRRAVGFLAVAAVIGTAAIALAGRSAPVDVDAPAEAAGPSRLERPHVDAPQGTEASPSVAASLPAASASPREADAVGARPSPAGARLPAARPSASVAPALPAPSQRAADWRVDDSFSEQK